MDEEARRSYINQLNEARLAILKSLLNLQNLKRHNEQLIVYRYPQLSLLRVRNDVISKLSRSSLHQIRPNSRFIRSKIILRQIGANSGLDVVYRIFCLDDVHRMSVVLKSQLL